jgi:hypothetical protein
LDATQVAVAIVGSASALYGFSIAYYAFARTLSRQEERWLWDDFRAEPPLFTEDQMRTRQRSIAKRRVLLNLLLIGTTVWFVPTSLWGLWYLSDSNPWALLFTKMSFIVLTSGVVAYFLVVGVLNIRDTYRDMQPPARGNTRVLNVLRLPGGKRPPS